MAQDELRIPLMSAEPRRNFEAVPLTVSSLNRDVSWPFPLHPSGTLFTARSWACCGMFESGLFLFRRLAPEAELLSHGEGSPKER